LILLYSQGTFPLYEIIKCSARKLQGFSTNAKLTLYYHSANEKKWNAIPKGDDWNKNVNAAFTVVFKGK
jgi:hypothetical protein